MDKSISLKHKEKLGVLKLKNIKTPKCSIGRTNYFHATRILPHIQELVLSNHLNIKHGKCDGLFNYHQL
jgi:hypothetical protein